MKKLLSGLVALIAIVVMSGCALPGASSSAQANPCAAKVVQELTTDKAVKGLWACLTPKFQDMLSTYVNVGYAISADDAVFTDGTDQAPPVVKTQYLGESNGVDVYVVVLKDSKGAMMTFTVTVWVDSSGKVDNFTVSGPTF